MERLYYRPVAETDAARPADALPLAGGWAWFARVELIGRAGTRRLIAARELPPAARVRLTAPRPAIAGLGWQAPRIMGILNVTPDSFSDGGRHDTPAAALAHAHALVTAGADMIDLGGESTRPGAAAVPIETEIARTRPVIEALHAQAPELPLSIDTRKAAVAAAAFDAGAGLVNDVAAAGFDPAMAPLVAARGAGLCLMHAQGAPETMQNDPRYENVLLDVYDWLEARVEAAEAAGIPRARILVDPGIGFGKTVAHNVALIRGLSLFHGLGCPILLGVSRKRFIGALGGSGAAAPDARGPGTLAVTLAGIAQGVQLHRVHDVAEAAQGIRLWCAATGNEARDPATPTREGDKR